MRKIMAAIDIGNSETKLVVAEMTGGKFNVLSVSETKTKGIKKNAITSEDELMSTITTVLSDSETKLNIKINKLVVMVPTFDIEFTIGEAKISVDGKVSGEDVSKVILESYKGTIPDNMELVNAIPMHFKIDDGEVLIDPKGKVSNSLSVKSVLLMSPKNIVYKILSVLDKLDIDIVDIGISPIGDYYAFKNNKIDKQIGAIVNIGGNNTTISIFNKGIITNVSTIELGGKNIDNDIAYIYKVDLDTANKLKKEFALATPKYASAQDEITVKNKSGKDTLINQQEISKVVYSRLKELLSTAKKEINHLTKKEISYIIITGGVSEMTDFKLVLEETIENNASIGTISDLGVRNNKFSSVIGLIKWYNYVELLKDKDYSIFTIEEQEEFSGMQKQSESNNSVIGKFFDYFLD